MDNVEATLVTLTVNNNTNTSQVTTTSSHNNVTVVKLDERLNLASSKVDLDGVVNLDGGVGVADGAAVVGNNVRNTLLTELNTLDLTELVLSLLASDSVDGEATLDVVDKTEVLTGLLKRDDIHETGGVGGVGSRPCCRP